MMLYLNQSPQSPSFRDNQIELSKFWFMFHFGDTITITERIHTNIIDLVELHQPIGFVINSITEFEFSPTQISELILKIIDKGVTFHSLKDGIHFVTNEDKIDVYPKVFDVFKSNSN